MPMPYKVNWKIEGLTIFFILLLALASLYFYQNFPDLVPTHWNFSGQADAWSGRTFAAFFFPGLILGIYLLMLYIPLLDPLKKRYREFSKVYQIIRLSLVLFMSALYLITSAIGLGYDISINKVMPLGIGLLFIILGNFMPKIKKNWFVGIRTPWTLSSEEVWNKTHRFGGKIFIMAGLLFILMLWLPENFFLWLFAFIMALIIIGTFGYSWWLWKKLKTDDKE